jgi:hypothetical protein
MPTNSPTADPPQNKPTHPAGLEAPEDELEGLLEEDYNGYNDTVISPAIEGPVSGVGS